MVACDIELGRVIPALRRGLSSRCFTPARRTRFDVIRFATPVILALVSTVQAGPPSFVNEVVPLLTRQGCNQGACHGKGSGQNGFRLSLRGYAPDWDHDWITREFDGRRINRAVPQASALLLKPTGQAPHEGGKLFAVKS